MVEPSRHRDGAALERKIRAAGRPWTMGDISMIADGQWAVRASAEDGTDSLVERRAASGRRVELTVEELARRVNSRFGEPTRDKDGA